MDLKENFADKALAEKNATLAFDHWMSQDTTRFILSLIPPGDQRDALITLLKDAFLNGASYGRSEVAVEILHRMGQLPNKQKG